MREARPFLDFKEIKQRVTIADILPRYQVNLVRVNQTSLKGTCPLPSHSSGSKNTFYVNTAKSVWYCHSDSCKKNGNRAGGNVIDFVAAMEQCSAYDAARRIEEMFHTGNHSAVNGTSKADAGARSAQHGPQEDESGSDSRRNKPLAFTLKDVNPTHPMIQEHGISAETAERFGIGFFTGKGSMSGRIVFPLHESGNLVGYVGRTTLKVTDTNPKWLFGKGLKKTFLYGLERCDPAKRLILCESFWGPPWFYEYGMQAAALMGLELMEEQERCLEPFPSITVALDNDQAGMEATQRICERLKAKHRVLKARLME